MSNVTHRRSYLELYNEWMRLGHLPSHGLCGSVGEHDYMLSLMSPSKEYSPSYWGYDPEAEDISWYNSYMGQNPIQVMHEFTPLRQTILLFMAAMNDEL